MLMLANGWNNNSPTIGLKMWLFFVPSQSFSYHRITASALCILLCKVNNVGESIVTHPSVSPGQFTGLRFNQNIQWLTSVTHLHWKHRNIYDAVSLTDQSVSIRKHCSVVWHRITPGNTFFSQLLVSALLNKGSFCKLRISLRVK